MTMHRAVALLAAASLTVGLAIAGPVPGAAAAGLTEDPAPTPTPTAPPAPPSSFPVVGAGFGHGVGMSQWGAYGMAQAGFDASAIVTHYYSGTSVTAVQDDADIRVNLLYQVSSARMRSEALDPTGGAIEVSVGNAVVVGGPADEFRFDDAGGQVTVKKVSKDGTVDLGTGPSATVRWAGTRTPGSAAGGPTLLNVAGPSNSLDANGHRYRFGFIEVVPVSTSAGTRLNVVNSLRIHEEYLYGISEVSSSWPRAALQAQVLAARTYALSKVDRGVRKACSCHVDDGGGPYFDQTFTGWSKITGPLGGNWFDAVNATLASDNTGLAILYEGKPISAFYSASSGGNTRSAKEAWGGDLPYAVSVPDPYIQVDANPYKSWTVNASQAQMAQLFGLGSVVSVDIVERNDSGTVKTVKATAPDGSSATRTGQQLARALGLRSTYITTISGNGGPALPGAAPPAEQAPQQSGGQPPADAPAQPAAAPVTPGSGVKQRVVSLLTPLTITRKVGRYYRVVGVVRPPKAGLSVWRQSLYKGTWVTVQKARTSAKGRYRFAVKAKFPGTTRTFRVLVVRKSAVVGVSPQFTVTVPRQR